MYALTDLVHPYSTISGATPVLRSSEHFFFRLSDPACPRSSANGHCDRLHEVANKAREWLDGDGDKGLADWTSSRDEPYFVSRSRRAGQVFLRLARCANRLPREPEGAPGPVRIDFAAFLPGDPDVEQVHFIGKDIVPPHAVLAGDAQVRRPTL